MHECSRTHHSPTKGISMRVIIQPNYEKVSKWTANYIVKSIAEFGPTSGRSFVLGLPTGSSPLGTYKELVKMNKEGAVSFQSGRRPAPS